MTRIRNTKTLRVSGVKRGKRWRGLLTQQYQEHLKRLRVIPQIARHLKADIRSLYRGALALQNKDHAEANSRYTHILTIIVKCGTAAYRWSLNLSDDPRILIWIPWGYVAHEIKAPLTAASAYAQALLHKLHLAPDEQDRSLAPDVEALLKDSVANSQRISKHLNTMRWLARNRDEDQLSVTAPHLIACVLWTCLSTNRRNQFIALLPVPLPQMPAVIYSPTLILHLLSEVSFEFAGDSDEGAQGHVYLELRQAQSGAEFRFTMQEYRLLPQTWERWQQNVRYALLRDLGGTLEPLTWDEGLGQGVIVRLPWANKS